MRNTNLPLFSEINKCKYELVMRTYSLLNFILTRMQCAIANNKAKMV